MGNTLVNTLDAKKAKKIDVYFLRNPQFRNKVLHSDNKLFKTYSCNIQNEANIIMKIYLKRDTNNNADLKNYQNSFEFLTQKLNINIYPNILPYSTIYEELDFAILSRQKIHLTLQERYHTVPYLKNIEKYWICFQLITCMYSIHNLGLYHGDIKSTNVLITTWNHIFITDFAFYKPNYIYEDQLEDIKYFYPNYSNKCNLAPEKFITKGMHIDNPITWFIDDLTKMNHDILISLQRMDIFSMGCIIAEIFLDGKSLFTYEHLISYRRGEYTPDDIINKIDNIKVRKLILRMIEIDPSKRIDSKILLIEWCQQLLPPSIPKLIYYLNANLISNHMSLPDHRIAMIYGILDTIYKDILGIEMLPHYESLPTLLQGFNSKSYFLKMYLNINPNLIELLGYEKPGYLLTKPKSIVGTDFEYKNMDNLGQKKLEVIMEKMKKLKKDDDDGRKDSVKHSHILKSYKEELILIIMMICTNLRSLRYLSTKLCAIEMLTNLSNFLGDINNIHVVIPYLFSLFDDQNSKVVNKAFISFCKIAQGITDPIQTLSDMKIFEDYVLPNIIKIYRHDDSFVIMSFIENIHVLIQLGIVYIQHSINSIIQEGRLIKKTSTIYDYEILPSIESPIENPKIEAEIRNLRKKFSQYLEEILIKGNLNIHERFLSNLNVLSKAFGINFTETVLIPLALSSMNNFPQTRLIAIKSLIGIMDNVSDNVIQYCLKPTFDQCLYDEKQELITYYCIKGLIKSLRINKPSITNKLKQIKNMMGLLIHPNQWIRDEAIEYFCYILDNTQPYDIYMNLQDELVKCLVEENEENEKYALMLNSVLFKVSLFSPLSRSLYEELKIKKNPRILNQNPKIQVLIDCLIERYKSLPDLKDTTNPIMEMKSIQFKPKNIINILANLYILGKSKFILDLIDENQRQTIHKKLIKQDTNPDNNTITTPNNNNNNNSNINANNTNNVNTNTNTNTSNTNDIEKINISDFLKTIKCLMADLSADICFYTTYQLAQINYIKTIEGYLLLCHDILDKIIQLKSSRVKEIGYHERAEKTLLLKNWHPDGSLLTTIYEHTGPVNCLDSNLDSRIFASGSNDGTIRVFDPDKIERELNSNSILKITIDEGNNHQKIKALKFLDNEDIVFGTDKGVIEVQRLLNQKENHTKNRYSTTMSSIQESSGIKAIQAVNIGGDPKGKCYMYITQKGELLIRDMNMKTAINTPAVRFNIGNDKGLVSSLLMSSIDYTVLIGTYSGYLLSYDLRCNLLSSVYQITDGKPILSMCNYYPTYSKISSMVNNSKIAISFGSNNHEFGIWDLHDFNQEYLIPEVYFTSTYNTNPAHHQIRKTHNLDNNPDSSNDGSTSNNSLSEVNSLSYLTNISNKDDLILYNKSNLYQDRMFYDGLCSRSCLYNILKYYADPLNYNQNTIKEKLLSNSKGLYDDIRDIFEYQNYVNKIVCLPRISHRDLQSSSLPNILGKDTENIIITGGNDTNIRYMNINTNQYYHINNGDGIRRAYNSFLQGDTTLISETIYYEKDEIRYSKSKTGYNMEKTYSDYQYVNGYSLYNDHYPNKYLLTNVSHKDAINDIIYMDKNDMLITCSRDHTIKLWK